MNMQTCSRCGGARFFGNGAVGWGGPICNCQYPDITNPDAPAQVTQLGYYNNNQEIIERLDRIEKLAKRIQEFLRIL
jgi:hypothetical protein